MKKQELTNTLELKKFQIAKISNPQVIVGGNNDPAVDPTHMETQG